MEDKKRAHGRDGRSRGLDDLGWTVYTRQNFHFMLDFHLMAHSSCACDFFVMIICLVLELVAQGYVGNLEIDPPDP